MCLAILKLVKTPMKPMVPSMAGPAVVVTLKDGCPCTKECHVALNALANACRGRIRFVGLLDGDVKKASTLAREAGIRFPIVPDPKLGAIRWLKACEALDLRLIGKDGRVAGRWEGLSRSNVASLVESVRHETGFDVDLDLTPFTVLVKKGCGYNP